jgi:uncharacterized cupin superfamily protein
MSPFTSEYRELALGARTFIHSGRRGRSATGSDRSIAISLETVVPEASFETTEAGLVPSGEGWFVVNALDLRWFDGEMGAFQPFESEEARFEQFGMNLAVLRPGEPGAMYHAEDAQEGFLILSGECLLVVEGQERRLQRWDFVHCPPMTEHVLIGTGDAPCVLVGVGARRKGRALVYPANETAAKHGASVQEETSDPQVAYARFSEDRVVPGREVFPL